MNSSQIIAILLIFGLAYFTCWVNLYRSYNDYNTQVSLMNEVLFLSENVKYLENEVHYRDRLNDLLTGRLLEMTKFASGEVDNSVQSLQNVVDDTMDNVNELIHKERLIKRSKR